MKNLKKALCLFLALVMCLGMLPVSVLAVESDPEQIAADTEQAQTTPEGEDKSEGKAEAKSEVKDEVKGESKNEPEVKDEVKDESKNEPEVKDEVPTEVKAFLDAVADIPEITPENAVEVSEYVYGPVSEAYEALLGTGYEERTDVLEAVEVYAAAIEAVDAALNIEEPEIYAKNISVYGNTLAEVKAAFRNQGILQYTGASVTKTVDESPSATIWVDDSGNVTFTPVRGLRCSVCNNWLGGGVFAPTKYCEANANDNSNLVSNLTFGKGTSTDSLAGNTECLKMSFDGVKPGTTRVPVTFYCNFELYYDSSLGDNGGSYRQCYYCFVYYNQITNLGYVRNDATWHEYSYTVPVTVNARYQLNYDSQGGSAVASTYRDVANTTATLTPSGTPTKQGFTFKGWAETPNATAADVISSVTLNWSEGLGGKNNPVEKTLYAVWEKTVPPITKELVTNATDANGVTLPEGVSIDYPVPVKDNQGNDTSEVLLTLPKNGDSVTLLYKITVTGEKGAQYTVTDKTVTTVKKTVTNEVTGQEEVITVNNGAQWISGGDDHSTDENTGVLTVTGTIPESGTVVIYVTKSFTKDDIKTDANNVKTVDNVAEVYFTTNGTNSTPVEATEKTPAVVGTSFTLKYYKNDGSVESNAYEEITLAGDANATTKGFTIGSKPGSNGNWTAFKVPTRVGYTFIGWDEKADATTPTYKYDSEKETYTPAAITVTEQGKTLYAVWAETNLEVKKEILYVKAPDGTIRYDYKPQPGDTIQYQITVTNKGNEAVENVVIIDKLDDNKLTFDSASGRGQSWNSEPDKGRYEVGKLDKVNTQTTSSYVLTINAIVKDNVAPGTTISNTATADCDDMPEGDKPSDSANVTVPNPKLTGFTKVLVRTEAEATAAGVNTEGITFPGNGEVKVPSGQTGVTLLYKITVTGEKGAVYEVGDMMNGKHADVVKGTLFGAFTEDGSVDIYVTMSFTQDDIANGKVTNTATVTPGANTDNKTPGADPTAPTKPSTATDESDANKQYKVTVNFKTEDGTELTTPVVTDPIDDGDDYIFRLTGGSWSTFSLRGTEIPVTVTDENGKTYSLDEVASAAELERLSGTINGKDEVINLIYALDEKGGDDTTKPEGGSDGTPDKYQAKVVYTATNGGTITSETKSEYLTIRDADGQMAAEGTITITGATASANTGNHFVNWTATATGHDDWNYTPTTAVELGSGDVSAKGNAVYTFTANFEADTEQVTITLTYDANGGSNAPAAESQTVNQGESATFTVSSGVPTRSNYRFTGWNTIAGGTGTAYSAGNTITTSEDEILYAQWEYTGGGNGGNGGGTNIPDTNPPTTDPGTDIGDENPPLANVDDKLNTTDHFAYIIGYPEGDVRPNANITRAEAVTIFFRLMTDEFRAANWSSENAYPDVESGDWFNNAISTLTKAGIFKGDETGNARPNDAITRAEFAALAARFMSDEIVDDGARFEDTEGHWAAADIRRAMLAGWIKGVGGNKFEPDRNITRAEVMTLVNRMLDRVADKDHMLSDMKVWSDNMDTSAWYYSDVQEATNGHDYERLEGELTEQWTALQEARDWAALETEWATAESGK